MSTTHRSSWFVFLICAIALGLVGCHRTPDETLIRQGIDAGASAAEHADASAFAGQLSDDFTGDANALDRRDLLNLLRVAKLRGESIHTLLGPIHIEPHGDRYVATFTATLTSGGGLLPADMGVYKVETGWRREGRHWLCYSASWSQQL
jgi:hypothetical protein